MKYGLWFSVGLWLLTLGRALSPAVADQLEGAAWRLTDTGAQAQGIRSLSGADGVTTVTTRGGSRCLANREGTSPPSTYLYFDVDDSRARGPLPPVYAVVEYFAEGNSGAPELHYDSDTGSDLPARYYPTRDLAHGLSAGADRWKTAVFHLVWPLFNNRQNLGADFRLSGPRLFVRSVQLTAARPPLEPDAAAGTWSVLSLPQRPGELIFPSSSASRLAMTVDASGNLYVADWDNGHGRIQRRDPQGNWFEVAAAGIEGGQVLNPWAIAVDPVGNLYVADGGSPFLPWIRLQKRDARGNWSELANPYPFAGASSLAVDDAGNLYVGNGAGVQKRDLQGRWSTHAAVDQVHPSGLTVDPSGNLYVAYGFGRDDRIEMRDTRGNWSVIATQGKGIGQVNFYSQAGSLTVDNAGNLYVSDDGGGAGRRLQKRDARGNWSLVASQGVDTLATDRAGNLYVVEMRSYRIRKRDAQGNWSLITTAGSAPGQVSAPLAVAVDSGGSLYVADWVNDGRIDTARDAGRIQKRDAGGNWSVIALAGTAPGQVSQPTALAADAAGNLYVAEESRIQKRDAQGNWTVIAPLGCRPHPLGGTICDHWVAGPSGLAVDSAGDLYVADQSGPSGQVQKRDTEGNWSVIAPSGAGIGQVTQPAALATDPAGSLYVVDYSDGWRVQKRDAGGSWSIVATAGDALSQIAYPDRGALAVDAAGNLYLADSGGAGRIQKRDALGNWSLVAPFGYGYTPGNVAGPSGLAVDSTGNLYVADLYNDRVMKYMPLPGP